MEKGSLKRGGRVEESWEGGGAEKKRRLRNWGPKKKRNESGRGKISTGGGRGFRTRIP